MRMDITETRRANLRRWVAINGTPRKEKSFFSQLKGTASFGERVARRLEEQYAMGNGFLDRPVDASVEPIAVVPQKPKEARLILAYEDEEQLLDDYRHADPRGQREIRATAGYERERVAAARRNKA